MGSIVLGNTVLSPDMIWAQRHSSEEYVVQEQKRTLGGRMYVFTGSNASPTFIPLESSDSQGWLTEAMVDSCYQMSLNPENTYQCVIGDNSYTVSFRHFDPPAFSATQLDQIGVLAPPGFYLATIKLFTVG